MSGNNKGLPHLAPVSREVFEANFETIFGKKTPKERYEEKKEAVLYDPRNQTDKDRNDND